MSYRKKVLAGDLPGDWGRSTAAHFPDQYDRDRFVLSVTTAVDSGWLAEPMLDDARGAWVRWRPGQFLRLNDVAYAHHGRITVALVHRRA